MRSTILAAIAVVVLSVATSSAKADHFRRHHVYRHYGHGVHYVAPYHVYHPAPVYFAPRHVYSSPRYYQHHHNYHYAHPGYSSFGVYGGGYSVHIGF